MLDTRLLFFALALCVIWLGVVFELVRRNKLSEGLSFVWVIASIFLTLCVVFSGFFTKIAHFFGIRARENAVLILGIATLAVAVLFLCTRISDLTQKVIRLSQDVAILRKMLKDRDEF